MNARNWLPDRLTPCDVLGVDSHRNLQVWQLAKALTKTIYALTRALPAEERFVVIPQLRRAAWSVQNNIAEGNTRKGGRELRHFLDTAVSSLAEVHSMIDTLPDLYRIDRESLAGIEVMRRQITAGIFAMLKGGGR